MRNFIYCTSHRVTWIRVTKKNETGGSCSMCGYKWNAYRILAGKREGKRPFGRSRSSREDNINVPKAIGWEGVDWIDLVSDRDKWRTVMDRIIKVSYYTSRRRRTLLCGSSWFTTNIWMNVDRSGKDLQFGSLLFVLTFRYLYMSSQLCIHCVCRREGMCISAKFMCVCWLFLCIALYVCVCVCARAGVQWPCTVCLFVIWCLLHFPWKNSWKVSILTYLTLVSLSLDASLVLIKISISDYLFFLCFNIYVTPLSGAEILYRHW